jgi:cystathionine beta-synthase
MYDDRWLEERGLDREAPGSAADLVAGRARAASLRPADTLLEAATRFHNLGVSAIPVIEGERVLGVVSESDLLEAALEEATHCSAGCRS